jgi:hypothetical protein
LLWHDYFLNYFSHSSLLTLIPVPIAAPTVATSTVPSSCGTVARLDAQAFEAVECLGPVKILVVVFNQSKIKVLLVCAGWTFIY